MPIGFKIAYPNMEKTKSLLKLENAIKKYLSHYFSCFSIVEFYIKSYQEVKIESMIFFLNFLERNYAGRYSFHLPKNFAQDLLNNNSQAIEFTSALNKATANSNAKYDIVWHWCSSIPTNLIYDVITIVQNKVITNIRSLIENEKGQCENNRCSIISYLTDSIMKNNIQNVGLCIDIGHICFDKKVGIDITEQKLNEFVYCIPNDVVHEFHIHSYNGTTDHCPLFLGIVDYKQIISFLGTNYKNIPLIFETCIENIFTMGLQEVNHYLP